MTAQFPEHPLYSCPHRFFQKVTFSVDVFSPRISLVSAISFNINTLDDLLFVAQELLYLRLRIDPSRPAGLVIGKVVWLAMSRVESDEY